MSESNPQKFVGPKEYLEKTFLEELSYKLWVTKGTRFVISKRLQKQADLSNLALGFLSSYLIIIGLLSVYRLTDSSFLNENVIPFASTSISILLLVFGQLESAKEFKARAKNYHKCGLELASMYNAVRIFKTYKSKTASGDDIESFCKDNSEKYQKILHEYENHEDFDYQKFQTYNKEYFELGFWKNTYYSFLFYKKSFMFYHLLIAGPPIVVILLFMLFNSSESI